METPQRPRSIVHLDADAFFASCEVASNQSLVGKPVAVGGTRRGIIASASYEARQMGVITPMPTSQALKICPSLVVISGNYEKYEAYSTRLFSILSDYTPFVEVTSIDEGYADFSGLRSTSPSSAARSLKADILNKLGLTVSIGLAANKFVAAVASKLRKPDSFLEVPVGDEQLFLAPLGVKWLPGVGPKMERDLQSAGFWNIESVAESSIEALSMVAGSRAARLREFARGLDGSEVVVEKAPAKSYGRQETFESDTSSVDFVRRILRTMADELMGRVRSDGKMVRSLEVRVRHPNMTQHRRSETLSEPTDLETDLYGPMDALLAAIWNGSRPIRLVGLKLSQVYDSPLEGQPDLALPGFARHPRRTLVTLMDHLNEKYGEGTLVRGHSL